MRVCVVGAGPSGLVAIKEAKEAGFEVDCYEASNGMGGVFSGEECEANRAYRRLYLTISNYYMAYSDFMPTDGNKFWSAQEYLDYLKSYAKNFQLNEHIHYKAKVNEVKKAGDKWTVTVNEKGQDITKTYDAVAVCCGTHQVANQLTFNGMEKFKAAGGKVHHSYNFLEPSHLKGRRVLAVGLGESGADIVREISNVSESCHLLMRGYPYIIPRVSREGLAADVGTLRCLYPTRTASLIESILSFLAMLFIYVPLTWLGILKWDRNYQNVDCMGQPKSTPHADIGCPATEANLDMIARWNAADGQTVHNRFSTKNASFIPNVVSKKIQVIIRRDYKDINCTGGKTIDFGQGEAYEFDDVVMCVGYNDHFPFLEEKYRPREGNVKNLFKHAFHPDAGPTLAFIGFCRPSTGAIPACAEILSRLWTLLLAKKVKLPSNLPKVIEYDRIREENFFHRSRTVNSLVTPIDFFDSVAQVIGCYPAWYSSIYWFNPMLFVRRVACPNLPCNYRLVGPQAKPEYAKKWISHMQCVFSPYGMLHVTWAKILTHFGLGEELYGWGNPSSPTARVDDGYRIHRYAHFLEYLLPRYGITDRATHEKLVAQYKKDLASVKKKAD